MRILGVQEDSVGEELKIQAGDELVSFDNHKVSDILDYEYYDSQESFSFIINRGGEEIRFDIEKEADETLGFEFDGELEVKTCHNNCLFCFVDQLPKEKLRNTLHIKDDDYRHSFISGTYVTLTNLSKEDIDRIIRLKLSPLFISVHSTDEDVRKKLLGVKKAAPVLPLLKKLSQNGIELHTQIVYCPGFNDDLENTINDLSPIARSLAIVPVGLTKDSNPVLKPVSQTDAAAAVALIEKKQKECLKKFGTRFVYAADEIYLKAGIKFPSADEYEDFCQIENGVGLAAKFSNDFDCALADIAEEGGAFETGDISIATGESAYALIGEKAAFLACQFCGNITVHKIENDFFGKNVTVAGLITGGDILNQLKGKKLGGRLLLPSVMLKEFADVFLDNMTVSALSKALNIRIEIVPSDGAGFVSAILKRRS